jgi:hypothetical protein
MSQIQPATNDEIISRASQALGKIDHYGRRGVTMLSIDESEAMALLLALLGLIPTPPGAPAPAAYFITNLEVTE